MRGWAGAGRTAPGITEENLLPTTHLIALGTRGDVAPYLVLAEELSARGHQVLVHGPTRYRHLAARGSVAYRPVGDVEMFGATEAHRRLVLSQAGLTYLHLRRRYRQWSSQLWAHLLAQVDPDDVLLCGLASAALARAWHRSGGRAALILLADVLPATGTRPKTPRSTAAHLVRRVRRRTVWTLAHGMSQAGDAAAPGRGAAAVTTTAPVPVVLAVSDTLCPASSPERRHVIRTGHLIRTRRDPVAPLPPGLPRVGRPDRPVVYVGLGSLGDPGGRILDRVAAAARDVGCLMVTDVPGTDPSDRPDIAVLPETDHRALFAHVTGVLHHGGAGTTITGLLAGRPTGIVPHLGDQFGYAHRVHELGAGPPPVRRHLLTARALRRALALLADPPTTYVRAAAGAAERLAQENGIQRTATACEQVIAGALAFGSTP